jgi:hypothetical protein
MWALRHPRCGVGTELVSLKAAAKARAGNGIDEGFV